MTDSPRLPRLPSIGAMLSYYEGHMNMADTHGPEMEWVTETDASTVKVGELVRLTDGQEVHAFHVDTANKSDGGVWFTSARHSFYCAGGRQFEVYRPVVVLPTSAGSVIRWTREGGGDHLIVLDDKGRWGSYDYAVDASKIKKFKVVSRPGFEVAEEVLKAVRDEFKSERNHRQDLAVVAARYGVDL